MSTTLQIFVNGSTIDELHRVIADLLPDASFGHIKGGGVGFVTSLIKGDITANDYESSTFPPEKYALVVDFQAFSPDAAEADAEEQFGKALFARLAAAGNLRLLYLYNLYTERGSAEPRVVT